MSSSDYQDILTALQALTQRAYQLGRSEALKRVIEVMQSDETPGKPLALMAPAETTPTPSTPDTKEDVSAESSVVTDKTDRSTNVEPPTPWWSRPARSIISPIRADGATTH